MRLRDFIRAHRAEIDEHIRSRPGMRNHERRFNDDDRADWIRNDEALYNWARSEWAHP